MTLLLLDTSVAVPLVVADHDHDDTVTGRIGASTGGPGRARRLRDVIGAVAGEHEATLLTRDQRALPIYQALGVTVEVIDSATG